MGRVVPSTTDPLLALNAAFMTDGVVLRIAKGVAVAKPILLRFMALGTTPACIVTRVAARSRGRRRVTLVESHEGAGVAHQENTVVEISVGDDASVRHVG